MGITIKPKTPRKINGDVKTIISNLNLTGVKPKYLRYTHRSNNYRAMYCFNNCENEAKYCKAKVVYGWMIWEDRKKSFIEAEFHSVLIEDGVLIDITPRQGKDDKILFVLDTVRASGRKKSNVWYSWSNLKMMNGVVIEEIQECEVVEQGNDYSEMRFL